MKNKLTEAVKNLIGEGYEVKFVETEKNNGVILQAISIRKQEQSVCSIIYVDGILNTLNKQFTKIEDAAQYVVDVYIKDKNKFNYSKTEISKEAILSNVFYRVVNAERNNKALQSIPHKEFLDLAVVFRCLVNQSQEGSFGFSVNNHMCNTLGISFDELDAAACKNTRNLGVSFLSIVEALSRIKRIPDDDIYPFLPMYVLTTKSGVDGASVLLYPDYFRDVAKNLNGDLFILPSSIYEVIVVPAHLESLQYLSQMVKEINTTSVPDEDFLSNSIYFYDRSKNIITCTNTYTNE